MSLTLSIGDKAPDFNLLDQYGKNVSPEYPLSLATN
jgi:peroxiredoxin